MNGTTQLGLLTELLCQIDFSKRGIVLSQPITSDCRYDYIADINDQLIRIQCKTAKPEANNIISITTASKNWNNGQIHNYIDDIDYFYTSYNGNGYLFPIDLFTENNRSKNIRLGEPKNYSNANVGLYGKDYLIDEVLKRDFCKESTIVEVEKREFHNRSNSEQKINYYCKDCGKPISVRNGRCIECNGLRTRKAIRPSKEELEEMIKTIPFTTIAKKYSVTDNTIRKWCDSMGLPRTKREINEKYKKV